MSGPAYPPVEECRLTPSFPLVGLVIGGHGDIEEVTSNEVASPEATENCLSNVGDLLLTDEYQDRYGMAGALDSIGVLRVCVGNTRTNPVECYKLTPASLSWEAMPPPSSRYTTHASAVVFQGSMFLMGGTTTYSSGYYSAGVEEFNISSNSWISHTQMPTAKHSFCAVNVDVTS